MLRYQIIECRDREGDKYTLLPLKGIKCIYRKKEIDGSHLGNKLSNLPRSKQDALFSVLFF